MRYFGTDGIRDLAGQGRLAPDIVRRLGRAFGRLAASSGGEGPSRVVLGCDPRPSGDALGRTLAGALSASGAQIEHVGIVPTPVVAWMVAHRDLDLGVALSASHNPPAYNGVKPFARGGRKLEPTEEAQVEAWMEEVGPQGSRDPSWTPTDGAAAYVDATVAMLEPDGRLDGRRLVVDLAAGAATRTAVAVLERLGGEVNALHPAGSRDINDACGTEHPAAWLAAVRGTDGAVGLAFDGDADRVLLSDAEGHVLDGDDALAILAEDLHGRGGVPGGCVVGTVMANLGLEERLASLGVGLERAPVGDRHVASRMRAKGAVLGGEPSGHVVLEREGALIGDGLVAGVRLLQAAQRLGRTLGHLRAATPRYPQLLENVRVLERLPLDEAKAFQQALRAAEATLGAHGRIVVRYSGTEPVLRVMAEGHSAADVTAVVADLIAAAKTSLGEG